MNSLIRLLFVGDVVGAPGRRILKERLRQLRLDTGAQAAVVNGENAAGGAGITPATAAEIFAAGADVITTGNHVWDKRDVSVLLARDPRVLRPANYPDGAPGSGVVTIEVASVRVAVVNLMGRLFMPLVDDPFRAADRILSELDGRARIVFVDFHAEATSEKMAFAWHLAGRVTAVVGTHTHVATADARILPGGTAYITDVGMTGPRDSVIGIRKEQAVERFKTQRPIAYETADGDVRLAAVLVTADPASGRAVAIETHELVDAALGAAR